MQGSVLTASFYARPPDTVARELLGKLLVRLYRGTRLSGIIVETEAYFGPEDPASRARHRGGSLARAMEWEPGKALVYGVHRQWLLNVVAHPPGVPGAVLFRALEPREGLEVMARLRGFTEVPGDLRLLTSGPGRLTRALGIDKSFHGAPMTGGKLWIEDVGFRPVACRCPRVGVSRDLEEPFRFAVRGSRFVTVWRGCRCPQ